jgi:DMSO/TMAO reductase YedYZ molybdopterin-dependent catalytic subunit
MTLFRTKAEQKLIEKGLDPARLPPGQYLTEKWPVLHAGTVPAADLATWDFRVFGEVEHEITLTYDELRALPTTELTLDIHCVTRWSRFDNHRQGIAFRRDHKTGRAAAGSEIRSRARRAGIHGEYPPG